MTTNTAMKKCATCGQTKGLTEYHVDRRRRDGLRMSCKLCRCAKARAYHMEHRHEVSARKAADSTRIAAVRRRYYRNNAGRFAEYQRSRASMSPAKIKAASAIAQGVREGRIVRPSLCECCGSDPGTGRDGRALIQAHHPDYSKPLDVVWCCPFCHSRFHANGNAWDIDR